MFDAFDEGNQEVCELCSVLKLTRVDVGNIRKKGKNMKGIIF